MDLNWVFDKNMNTTYSKYLDFVMSRLNEDKFELHENQQVKDYKVDLFGYRMFSGLRISYTAVCGLRRFDGITLEELRAYSTTTYDFASEYKSAALFTCFAYPVVVAETFSQDLKSFILTYAGKHFHGGYWYVEHPILAELSTSSIFHYQKFSFLGALPERAAMNVAKKYFSFEGK
jgi:hypothetical protein